MKKFEMRVFVLASFLVSVSAFAQAKKRLNFNSYLKENLQIIAHNKKAEKNQLAFDELKSRAPANDNSNTGSLKSGTNNGSGNGSVWNSLGGNSVYSPQQQQEAAPAQAAPAAPAAPTSSGDSLPQ